jgi:copper homeostasis protein
VTPYALEIAVSTPGGAAAALAGGADRVELCVALELGGLTPSQGLIESTVAVALPVNVLIRPRPGDFSFDAADADLMERETIAAVRSGAAGVVIGALTPAGTIDLDIVTRLIEAARATNPAVLVTFHRAIDQSVHPVAAFEALSALRGVDRVLTSGGASSAGAGVATLARMAAIAGGPVVMAGGGLVTADVSRLAAVGIADFHTSAKRRTEGPANAWIPLGSGAADVDSGSYFVTDAGLVATFRAVIDSAVG